MNNENLESKLWEIANSLRGQMDSSEFKNYMLGFIFFKFLSENLEETANNILKEEDITTLYKDIKETDDIYKDILDELKYRVGYYIEPKYLFSNFVNKITKGNTIIEDLSSCFRSIEISSKGEESEADFEGLFDDIDLNNNKLGATLKEKSDKISSIIISINKIEGLTKDTDVLGKAYEYLIKMFASDSGKKGGEFYTPNEVSLLLSKLVSIDKSKVINVYDPTCGSGSLLLNASKEIKEFEHIYGQELNVTTFNLARMNMFLHGVNYKQFEIKQGNTLLNDKFIDTKMDIIVANPPFGTKWDPKDDMLEDERFKKYGKLAPKSKGEYAFLQHMLHHLSDSGVMASVVPHGVLFRGAAELVIRKYMIEKDNVLDAVIGLPSNLFYGTGIPACILVFKKCRDNDDIMFIDASREFEKVKTQNVLTSEHINKIVDTYQHRSDVDKYSRKVSIDEIIENEYNLNIPRYIDTFEEEEPIDIDLVNSNISRLKEGIAKNEIEIEKMIKELGLDE